MEVASLLGLSHELLHCIFIGIDPADLAALSQTCRALHSYIKGNRLLHKDIYLSRYDEPSAPEDGPAVEPTWEENIHGAVKLEKILQSGERDVKREHLGFVAEQVHSLLDTAARDQDKSLNIKILSEYFDEEDNQDNIDVFLCSSALFNRAGTEMQRAALTPELQQASAKLHCLYGKPVEPCPTKKCSPSYHISPFLTLRHIDISTSPSANTRFQTRGVPAHTVARSKVYDLRQYTDDTRWGPFCDDGSQKVDWERVEAIMIVLGFNLNKFSERHGRFPLVWDTPFEGATPRSWTSPVLPSITSPYEKDMDREISIIRELAPSIDNLDPYGVTGTWMRVVCFLDYNDLYAFNFSTRIPTSQDRDPIETEEAIRLIRIKLQVTRIDPPPTGEEDEVDEEEDGMDWSNFQGKRLPIVHFRGSSRSLHAHWDPNANSRIRGSVRQTPEGEIRWTTFSIFHGEEKWRSEGIQVGGLRSARGILGNWFDKDYDEHGPAGPTAFWKVSDEVGEERSTATPLAVF